MSLPTGGVGLLGRVLSILGCFSEDDPELTAAELGERTQLAGSTLHRIIAELLSQGLLVRMPQHRYSVGSKLWELGELSPLSLRLRERAIPHLTRLYEATGENVHLGVLDGGPEQATVLYVGRVTGRRSIPTVSRAGGRGPLHTTGVGKALLAATDETWLARYFTSTRERETVYSITEESALREDLEVTRARGYAVAREEMTLGNISIAVDLAPVAGLPRIALGLVVHKERADELKLARLVQQSAREIRSAVREA